MNLYKIVVAHYAPKGSHHSIKDYLLAENDEQVYNYIDGKLNYGKWSDRMESPEEDDETIFEIYDDKYNVIGTENYKEKIIRLKGDIDDDEEDFGGAYYGITLYGWELIKEGIQADYNQLLGLGVIKQLDHESNKD